MMYPVIDLILRGGDLNSHKVAKNFPGSGPQFSSPRSRDYVTEEEDIHICAFAVSMTNDYNSKL